MRSTGAKLTIRQVHALVESFGTPIFVLDLDEVARNIGRLLGAFPDALLAYSYKTNWHPELLKLLAEHGLYAEVASEMELEFARRIGVQPSTIIFNGPGKSCRELELAIRLRIFCLVVNSLEEIGLVEAIAKRLKCVANVGIRINPHWLKRHKRETWADHKFGVTNVRKAIRLTRASQWLEPVMVHVHAGTNLSDERLYCELLVHLEELADDKFPYIDIGGGFATEERLRGLGKSISLLGRAILSCKRRHHTLVVEPGRYVAESAGYVVARVNNIQENGWVVLDVGSNLLIPLNTAKYRVHLRRGKERYNIGGNLCFGGDVLATNVLGARPSIGQPVLITNAGAYTLSMSSQFCYPRPKVVVKRNGKFRLATPAELPKDVFEHWVAR